MKTSLEVSAEKLRGGFYSPQPLVQVCLDRIVELIGARRGLRVLEPSAGDGAFIHGIAAHPIRERFRDITAIELVASEGKRAQDALSHSHLPGRTLIGSAISLLLENEEEYDVALGNPPFVRYQFVTADDRRAAEALSARLRLPHKGVSNLWIPVLLSALNRLARGGVLAFIIPSECLTGVSAGVVRSWLTRHVQNLRFDLFPPGSFPGVLQQVVSLSGQKREGENGGSITLTVAEHDVRASRPRSWTHNVPVGAQSWTRYLLTPDQLDAYREAQTHSAVHPLGHVAKFEVAAVTGANEFFSIGAEQLKKYGLAPWAVDLLPRIRHARGLRYTERDQQELAESSAKAFLLDFAASKPDPLESSGASQYLSLAETSGIPLRYKCRIRTPWFRVPWIKAGPLMLSKRSHRYPRVVLNEARVVTTDTIYRGALIAGAAVREPDLVAGFHNSLTMLSAEIEGRSFGGGVLELVPSEIARLLVPILPGFGDELDRLDDISRGTNDSENNDELVDETDRLLLKTGLRSDLLDTLREGRSSLLARRLERTASGPN
jgi:adenine-specific DNA-methyltransferase